MKKIFIALLASMVIPVSAVAESNVQGDYYEKLVSDCRDDKFEFTKELAEEGNSSAMLELSNIYLDRKDTVNRIYWLNKAVDSKNMNAVSTLGAMYYTGDCIAEDANKAYELNITAAKEGIKQSQALVGLAYFEGKGVKKDFERSYMWLGLSSSMSASPINRAASRVIELIEPMLSLDAKMSALSSARTCMIYNYKGCY